jgi:hypothetical protein
MNEPEKPTVKFLVLGDSGEIEELTMDENDYNDMVEYENKYEIEKEERRRHHSELEHRMMRYDRD